MIIKRITLDNQVLKYYLVRCYALIGILIACSTASCFSKVFALPPILDLYKESYEQNSNLSSHSKPSSKLKQATRAFKSIPITLKVTHKTLDQLKQKIRYLEQVVEEGNKQLAEREKIIQSLRKELLQFAPNKQRELPILKSELSVQKIDRESILKKSNLDSQSLTDWKTLKTLLKKQAYQEAEIALQRFIQDYPNDIQTINAYYFLGQVGLVLGKPDQALNAFNALMHNYPKNKYISNVHYHRALAYYAKGDHIMAESLFKKLEKNYPHSEAAKKAVQQREQLGLI